MPDGDAKPDAAGQKAGEGQTTMLLILDLVLRVMRLVGGEFALARAEMSYRLRRAALGAVLVLLALMLTGIALVLLAGALVSLGESHGLSPIAAHLAAAGGFVAAALVLGWIGARSLRPKAFIPRQTLESVRRDLATLSRKETR